jgi:hypothetical protein
MNALLMTTGNMRILVPRSIVAEVIGASLLEFSVDEASGLTTFLWRGRRVPLLRAAAAGDAAVVPQRSGGQPDETKVAVFHGLKQQQQLPFYGCVVAGNPRLLRLEESDLAELECTELQPAELMRVRVEGEEASIPKVDQFESTLIDRIKRQPAR